jgi:hypothetical protein
MAGVLHFYGITVKKEINILFKISNDILSFAKDFPASLHSPSENIKISLIRNLYIKNSS